MCDSLGHKFLPGWTSRYSHPGMGCSHSEKHEQPESVSWRITAFLKHEGYVVPSITCELQDKVYVCTSDLPVVGSKQALLLKTFHFLQLKFSMNCALLVSEFKQHVVQWNIKCRYIYIWTRFLPVGIQELACQRIPSIWRSVWKISGQQILNESKILVEIVRPSYMILTQRNIHMYKCYGNWKELLTASMNCFITHDLSMRYTIFHTVQTNWID